MSRELLSSLVISPIRLELLGGGLGGDGIGIHPTRLTCLVGVSVLAWAMRTSVVEILLLGDVGGSQGAGWTGFRRDR